MRIRLCIFAICLLSVAQLEAQVKIGDNPQNIDAASILELESTTGALVITRVTTAQMNGITPLQGAVVYNTDENCVFYYEGTAWANLCNGSGTTNVSLELVDSDLILTDSAGNTVTAQLENILDVDIISDPVEITPTNMVQTLNITRTGNEFNIQVAEIHGSQIADFTVTGQQIGPSTITQDKLAPQSVGQTELQQNAVADNEIDYDQVTLSDFTNDAGYVTNVELISPEPNNAIIDNNGAFYDDTPLRQDITTATDQLNQHLTNDEDLDSDNERLSNIELSGNRLIFTEGGVSTLDIDLGPALTGAGSDNQQLSIAGDRISLTNGGFVDLPAEVDGNITNELQDLQFNPTTNILTLTTPATIGNQVDLSALAGGAADGNLTNVELNGNDLEFTTSGGGFNGSVDLSPIAGGGVVDGVISNVTFDGSDLNFTGVNGGFNGNVDISALGGGVDGVVSNVVLNGTDLEFTGANGGFNNTVDLSPLENDQIASEVPFTPAGNTVSNNVQDAIEELQTEIDGISAGGAANPNDELNTTFEVNGANLEITDAGGTLFVPLADINTGVDTNTTNVSLTEDGTDLILTDSDGNTVTLALADIDTDTNTTNVSLTEDGTDLILTDSDGNTVTLALADIDTDTNTTNVSLTEDGTDLILTDSDGNTVTLALADINTGVDTNTTNVSLTEDGTDLILTDSDGNTVTLALADINTGVDTNTTNVSLTEDGTDLILTDSDGNTVTLALADIDTDTNTTNVSLTEDGTDLILTDSDGNTVTLALADIDTDTNTTNVSLTEDGTDLILTDSDGNTVTLALADINTGVDTNTTNVSLTEDGTDLILTDSDGNTVTLALADINTGVDTNTTNVSLTEDGTDLILTDSDGNTVTLALADLNTGVDTNTTNVSLTEDGTDLILTDSDGNTVTLALADIDTNTTNVSLTEDGTDLILTDSDGNTVTLALADIDTNTTNVSLTEDGTDLILTDSDGNTVTLALADLDNQNATEVPVAATPTNYNPATPDVEAHLAGIDAALAATTDQNFAENDLTLDAIRTHDLNSFNLLFRDNSGAATTGRIGIGNLPGAPQSQLDVNGQIRARQGVAAIAGSAAEPGYAFHTGDDMDTGMFRIGVDQLGLSTGGTSALNIDATQNITVTANLTVTQDLELERDVIDINGDTGTLGQVLSSTGAGGVQWINGSGIAGSEGSVFFAAPVTGAPIEDNNNFFWDDTNDRLGLGTNTPQTSLHVQKQQNNALFYGLQLQNQDGNDGGGSAAGMLFAVEGVGQFGKGALAYERTAGFGRGSFHILQNSNTSTDNPSLNDAVMTVTNTGDVGLGTTNPQGQLHVTRAAGNNLSYGLQLQNEDGTDGGGSAAGMLFAVEGVGQFGKGALAYERTAGFGRGSFHILQNSNTSTENPSLNDAVMTVTNTGDVGLGTTNPQGQLHVTRAAGNNLSYGLQLQNEDGTNGGGSATGMLFAVEGVGQFGKGALAYERTAGFGRGSFHILQNSNTSTDNPSLNDAVMTITNTGDVGLGTTTPQQRMHITNAPNGSVFDMQLQRTSGTVGETTGMLFSVEGAGQYGKGALIFERTTGFARGDFHFLQNADASTANPDITDAVMTIKSDGDVGIGTIVPEEVLHVAGNIRADGSFISNDTNIQVPDYVFQNYFDGYSSLKPSYNFSELSQVEAFIKKNKHLPGVTSAAEAKEKGRWNLSASNLQNLEKIEELFLHTIAQEKKIQALESQNQALTNELEAMKTDLELIKKMLMENKKDN